MTMWLPEHLRHLPIFDGKPVPWVAIWTAERRGPTMTLARDGLVPVDRRDGYARQEFGVWCIAGPTLTEGTPEFGSTHSARQRKAMRELRCQVCGRSPKQGGGKRLWTIPPEGGEHEELWERNLVINAPTCEDCWRFVTQADGPCPYVARQKVPAFTGPSTPWGLSGTVVLPGEHEVEVLMEFGDRRMMWLLGRELIMRVSDPKLYRYDRDPVAAAASKIK
jgi:hypothetical protein